MTRALLIAVFCCVAGIATAECPMPRDNGGKVSATGKKLALSHSTQVIAGGALELLACAEVPGTGRVAPRPDVTVMLAENDGRALEFRSAGDCDTVLLVASAGAWHFNDDDAGGPDARIRLDAASDGRYDVWVGSYGRGSCRARLIVETFR